jgi:predicted dehydrogenase/threonine dehydrogenase-like Zn-dependent dehydrogenase
MKQVVQNMRSGETEVVDVPVPQAAPGMALVRTGASLVSAGTERATVSFAAQGLIGKARSRPDLVRQVIDKAITEGPLSAFDAVRTRLGQPQALGYSSAGTVVSVGEGLSDFAPGDRVVCAGGGYAVHAEYARVPRNLMAHLPDSVDLEAGAFATLGAIALHGFRLSGAQLGERVAVIGMGLLGQLALSIVRASGGTPFGVDLSADRVVLGRERGFAAVTRGEADEESLAFTQGLGFDVVLICADTPDDDPIVLASEIARDRATVVAIGNVGLGVPRRTFYGKELNLVVSRSYGPGRYDPAYEEAGRDYPAGFVRWTEGRNLEAVASMLASGQIDVSHLISHRVPIDDAAEAYELIGQSDADALGVVLVYPQGGDVGAGTDRREPLGAKPGKAAAVRIGVLGAGNFAIATALPAIDSVRGVQKMGLASAGGLSGAHAGRRHGYAYATTSVDDILGDADINTVAVFTRHDLHAAQTVQALQAGKHVFCEKPVALNEDELTDVAKAIQAAETLYTVGFNRRFSPFGQALKAHFGSRQEPIVCTYRVNAGWIPPDHWVHDPEQGGRLLGEVCHFVDFLIYLTGAHPTQVGAHSLPDNGRYSQDNLVLSLRFDDGSVGSIVYVANGDRALGKERVEVFGGGRAGVLDDFRRLTLFRDGRSRTRRNWLRQDKGHRALWQAFVNSITNGASAPIPYDDILATSLTTFAARDSLQSGQAAPVRSLAMG